MVIDMVRAARRLDARQAGADVVVAHDYLTQRGGAERVALELALQFEARELITSVHDPALTFDGFHDVTIRQSDSKLLRGMHGDMRRALPLLAPAWTRFEPVDSEILLCSSSGWAHGLRAGADTFKVVYCHNPARWLYQRSDYLKGHSLPVRATLAALSPALRTWDARAAHTADLYIANSRAVATRIHDAYGIRAEVVHPPVSVDAGGVQHNVPGLEPGYFLTVSRARGYKGTELLIDAFARMPQRRLVIVGSLPEHDLPANVTALGVVSEQELRWLYTNATALTSVSHEDFGLTVLEANSFGCPALVLRAGGFLESTAEGVSGLFIEEENSESIVAAVRGFPTVWDDAAIRAHAERFSSASFARQLRDVIDSRRSGSPHSRRP